MERGRFPASTPAQEGEEFSIGNIQVEGLDSDYRAKTFADPDELDSGHGLSLHRSSRQAGHDAPLQQPDQHEKGYGYNHRRRGNLAPGDFVESWEEGNLNRDRSRSSSGRIGQ